jgi:uncharacterized protein YbjT (DUF2867 family)
MNTIKTVFVTGATGNQGGGVAKKLINNQVQVKALTRDPASIKAQKLIDKNLEYVKGDLNDINSYREYMQGVDAVFSVQSGENGTDAEIKQGKDLANVAKKIGVKHFIYSSVAGADLHTGIPHWESKHQIEEHIKEIGLPFTILRPTYFYENYLFPQVKSRILKGKLVTPLKGEKVLQLMSATDVGEMCWTILNTPEKFISKTITMASEQLTHDQVAEIFSEVMGRKIKYTKLPAIITRLAMGKNLFKMFSWLNSNSAIFIQDLEGYRKEYPNGLGIKKWIIDHFKNHDQ